jgi:hypothetical protein
MGGVPPETCRASYKYEIKRWYTVASCWDFYVNYIYYDARIHEQHRCTDWRSCRVCYIHFLRTKLHGVRSEQPWKSTSSILFALSCGSPIRTGTLSVLFIAFKTWWGRALQKWRNKEGGNLQSTQSYVESVSQGHSTLSNVFFAERGKKVNLEYSL